MNKVLKEMQSDAMKIYQFKIQKFLWESFTQLPQDPYFSIHMPAWCVLVDQ